MLKIQDFLACTLFRAAGNNYLTPVEFISVSVSLLFLWLFHFNRERPMTVENMPEVMGGQTKTIKFSSDEFFQTCFLWLFSTCHQIDLCSRGPLSHNFYSNYNHNAIKFVCNVIITALTDSCSHGVNLRISILEWQSGDADRMSSVWRICRGFGI